MIDATVTRQNREFNLRWAAANPELMALALEEMGRDYAVGWKVTADFSQRGYVRFNAVRGRHSEEAA